MAGLFSYDRGAINSPLFFYPYPTAELGNQEALKTFVMNSPSLKVSDSAKKASILPWIVLIIGIIVIVAQVALLFEGVETYKREMLKYMTSLHKAEIGNWDWRPESPVFIHGNNNKIVLEVTLAISFIGILYVVFSNKLQEFKFHRLNLLVYSLAFLLSLSLWISHLFIGISDNPYKTSSKVQNYSNSVDNSEVYQSEHELTEEPPSVKNCPIASMFGIGVIHYYFHSDKNEQYYVGLRFISDNEAQIILPDGKVITKLYSYYYDDRDTHSFGDKGGFSLRDNGKFLTYRINPTDKYNKRAQYVGVSQANNPSVQIPSQVDTYSVSDQESSTTNYSRQRTCSLCNGKGWRPGNKATQYEMGEVYCSECGDYFPGSHSHDLCPSCQGRGYVNY